MSFGGDNSQWSGSFPDDLIPDVLQLVLDGWWQMPEVKPDSREEATTRRLREILCRLKRYRELPFTIWPESSETDPSSGKEKGRIDLRFLHGYLEGVYFAFECKRLYYQDARGKTRANVSEYTGDAGMMCFITGKYSRGLPNGGMIGYVLNGNIDGSKAAIKKSMEDKRDTLRLKPNTTLGKCGLSPKDEHLAESIHNVNGRDMTIYHILLPN